MLVLQYFLAETFLMNSVKDSFPPPVLIVVNKCHLSQEAKLKKAFNVCHNRTFEHYTEPIDTAHRY